MRNTCAVSSRRRRKRILKQAKGFVGDRKGHIRLTKDAVMKAMAFNSIHRKQKKRNFRSLWIVRIGAATRPHGLSYHRFIHALSKAHCSINRKMLSEMSIHDPEGFACTVERAKQALA